MQKKFSNYTNLVEELYLKPENQDTLIYCLDFNDDDSFKNENYSTDSANINIGFKHCF